MPSPCTCILLCNASRATAPPQRMFAAITAPCSVKAHGRYRRPPWELVANCDQFVGAPARNGLIAFCDRFPVSDESTVALALEVAICDLKLLNSAMVSLNAKSAGNRWRFLLTASLKRF